MTEIRIIPKEDAWRLRHEVMWPNEPLDFVKLEDDDEGMHYGLFDEETLISAVSLFLRDGEAQFRKFATLPAHQNRGHGSKLLAYVLREAERAGAKRIHCNSRSEKAPFYEKFGLSRTANTFRKKEKDYVVMERRFE